ncbi:hypothetical protein TcasGA2_TC005659 [Tribolium castaneum]|uniref:Uncharacterized protein n=1 Tax=Tribolium castaneum TaxID=7070 RepID=D6WX08_TRICA|nr:hypothetical protein TcasGA2_TC005659 [Tribolium castaneum]
MVNDLFALGHVLECDRLCRASIEALSLGIPLVRNNLPVIKYLRFSGRLNRLGYCKFEEVDGTFGDRRRQSPIKMNNAIIIQKLGPKRKNEKFNKAIV